MVRMNIQDAVGRLPDLIDRVERGGESIELERDDRVVVRITPGADRPTLQGKDLKAFFESLPDLGADREAFARDIESARDVHLPDRDPWAE